MKAISNKTKWLSVHIYIEIDVFSSIFDHFIVHDVLPSIIHCQKEKWIFKYFFVRYFEDGNHLRLRLEGIEDELNSKVKPFLINHFNTVNQNSLSYKSIFSIATTKPNIILKWIAYKPETDRYGGKYGVSISEDLFYHSSKLSILILKQLLVKDKSIKLGRSLFVMMIIMCSFDLTKQDSKNILDGYINNFNFLFPKEFVKSVDRSFDQARRNQGTRLEIIIKKTIYSVYSNETLPNDFEIFKLEMVNIKDDLKTRFYANKLVSTNNSFNSWQQVVFDIIPSYLHMMNNRLGISPIEEMYLCYLAVNSF